MKTTSMSSAQSWAAPGFFNITTWKIAIGGLAVPSEHKHANVRRSGGLVGAKHELVKWVVSV